MKSSKRSSEKPDTILSLKTVQKMLPLVERIMGDILVRRQNLAKLVPEQDRLDRFKVDLSWPERQRRYELQLESASHQRELDTAMEELTGLGVVLLDPSEGRVGFPTRVNDRAAFFSWRVGDEGLRSWHFAEETNCRPIPQSWLKEISYSGKS
jgi:hypothetical protein